MAAFILVILNPSKVTRFPLKMQYFKHVWYSKKNVFNKDKQKEEENRRETALSWIVPHNPGKLGNCSGNFQWEFYRLSCQNDVIIHYSCKNVKKLYWNLLRSTTNFALQDVNVRLCSITICFRI